MEEIDIFEGEIGTIDVVLAAATYKGVKLFRRLMAILEVEDSSFN